MKTARLVSLIQGASIYKSDRGPDREIGDIKADSRSVSPGDSFIALNGTRTRGSRFIPEALKAGASVVIFDNDAVPDMPEGTDATWIHVPDTKKALDEILPFVFPGASKIALTGITGTSGKTTTAWLIESILKEAGYSPGLIGTIETRYKEKVVASMLTTPGSIELFQCLDEMYSAGCRACVMEVSSHALDQNRTGNLGFETAVFTNLGQDHLDYHLEMSDYFEAKKRLFTEHLKGRAIINYDDLYGKKLITSLDNPITFGFCDDAMVHATQIKADIRGIWLDISTHKGPLSIMSPLVGRFHAFNIMAATGACMAMGIHKDAIKKGIASLQGVPGRMEYIQNPYQRNIIVDFAHKPNALQQAITSARELTRGTLTVLFGCGGDRDSLKRPMMGQIAAHMADRVCLTSDNPRSEDPDSIITDILEGIEDSSDVEIQPDRAKAIKDAIRAMTKNDTLLVAGKGHETCQIMGSQRLPFDDRTEVIKALKEVFEQ
ncbi:MAG: UDP-N-acetylmuramoyl-L-alanyl-D-glutamate--2,6-diaminopimelate ligase [Thermodesulfobacteriota bacterium]|nr:UDP-N-acetylmuramoyl-L-alanyl-D-glutamate--2,6-diaminopimelate ligase [Thermodesulfobacteriota bacterium]